MIPAAPRASCRLRAGARRGPVPDPGLRVLPPGVRRRGLDTGGGDGTVEAVGVVRRLRLASGCLHGWGSGQVSTFILLRLGRNLFLRAPLLGDLAFTQMGRKQHGEVRVREGDAEGVKKGNSPSSAVRPRLHWAPSSRFGLRVSSFSFSSGSGALRVTFEITARHAKPKAAPHFYPHLRGLW